MSWQEKAESNNNMEVTRENFKDVMADLPTIIQKAQFIAFDTEFTGLQVEGASSISFYDTLEDFYVKSRLNAETFMAIQFGLVAFFYDEEKNKYTHQAFNFYIYPSSKSDVHFTCQNSSIDFLVQHGFDFNKVFRSGIPYLKEEETKKLLDKLDEKFEKMKNFTGPEEKIKVPLENEKVINEILTKVKNILKNNCKESFITKRHNSFIRKLIYNSIENEFGSKILIESNKDETLTISVGCTPDDIKEKYLIQKNKILDEVGFCNVIKLLIESEKLLIGHNLMLDLLFTIRQFITPLPSTYSEFKELARFFFPRLLDTKHMVFSIQNIKDSSLNNLIDHFGSLNIIPNVEMIEEGKGYKIDDKKLHEAAYDAYLSGLCFLSMSKILGNSNCNSNIFKTLPESVFLKEILNKIFVPKLHDINHMNLGGLDNEPDREGVYHLTFPKEWTRDSITNLFKDCGFINISWLSNTTAFVKVKKEFICNVEANLRISNSNYKICSYNEFKTANNTETVLNPLTEKKLKHSSNKVKNNDASPFKLGFNGTPKRKNIEEDIGEVIERPQKKQCTS